MYQNSSLLVRELNIELLDNLESQIFIQQLLDIEDIDQNSKDEIREFTFKKLRTVNTLSNWVENKEIYQIGLENLRKKLLNFEKIIIDVNI